MSFRLLVGARSVPKLLVDRELHPIRNGVALGFVKRAALKSPREWPREERERLCATRRDTRENASQ
jgi:hypothetical protein